MIIRCDNCSVSLQLDESKIPSGNFTVRCPRCQNMLRANKDAKGQAASPAEQLAANKPAPATDGPSNFAEKQSEFEINSAMRSLLAALQSGKAALDKDDEEGERPRRVLLCLGEKKDEVAKLMSEAGYRVYLAQTPLSSKRRTRCTRPNAAGCSWFHWKMVELR
jgi:predicted Zn finger-like uncharacterized protein